MAITDLSTLVLGSVALLTIVVERTCNIWISSIGNFKLRALASSLVMWLPPIFVFFFLVPIILSTLSAAGPWALAIAFIVGLVLIYIETRREKVSSRTPNRKKSIHPDKESQGSEIPGPTPKKGKGRTRVMESKSLIESTKNTSAKLRKNNIIPSASQGTVAPTSLKQDRATPVVTKPRENVVPTSQEDSQKALRIYSLTEKAKQLLEFKSPFGRRGGGPLHVKMIRVLYNFYVQRGCYPIVDEGNERKQKPDLLVWEPKIRLVRLKNRTVKEVIDAYEWEEKPFHVEAETTPKKSKSSVIENYLKARRLNRYVVFAVPTKQDADDLKKILNEINAPEHTYEIDDISDLLPEDSEQAEPGGKT